MAIPAWRRPLGVSASTWEYVTSASLAKQYDASLADSPLAAIDVRFVLERLPPRSRVLDLGCGTGRFHPPLLEAGHGVVGVDLSESMLRTARERTPSVPLVRGNLCELGFLRDGEWDACLCMFATLGLVEGAKNRQRVFDEVARLLRPGGQFLFHVHNRWWSWRFRDSRWELLRGAWRTGDVRMPPHQGLGHLTMHLFTRREVACLVSRAGLKLEEMRALGGEPGGVLSEPTLFSSWRALGYLVRASKT